jgi:hypothetical protein
MTTALILYASGLPLAAVWFAWLFRDLPNDELGDLWTAHGIVATVLFVLFWPIVLVGMIYIYLSER